MTTIAVTGATGHLGGHVARLLAADGADLVLVVRDPSRAPHLPKAQVRRADYRDAAAVRAALSGVDTVLMVSASEAVDRVDHHRTFVDAAADAGVGHVVYTSVLHASATATFTLARDQAATEAHLRASGLPWTFLRDALYADSLPLLADDEGVIRGPAGDGRVAAVARADVADAAAAVLRSPQAHRGATYDLTGPEDLDLDQAAEIIGAATGRSVRYQPETVDEAYASRASLHAPRWLLDAWVSTYTAIAADEMSGVSTAIPDLTGHRATSLAELLSC